MINTKKTWQQLITAEITERGGVKDSWRAAYTHIHSVSGRVAADSFLFAHASKRIPCPRCSALHIPKLHIRKFAGGAHVAASCPVCGRWIKWLKQTIRH